MDLLQNNRLYGGECVNNTHKKSTTDMYLACSIEPWGPRIDSEAGAEKGLMDLVLKYSVQVGSKCSPKKRTNGRREQESEKVK